MPEQPLKHLSIRNFSVFHHAEFEFVPGVNVFIGENGTGKSHLLKLIYSMLKPFDASETVPKEHPMLMKDRFLKKLAGVFRPDDNELGRLVSDIPKSHLSAKVHLDFDDRAFIDFRLSSDGKLRPLRRTMKATPESIFIPPREVLAIYEGFLAIYTRRELSFDETYFDLCNALAALPLRAENREHARPLLERLERIVGGRVRKHGQRFYLENKGHRAIEAHLMAEGFRKLATLYRLIANGKLKNGILLLDEPEASLNPKLVTQMVLILREIAVQGVQVFISTHDFLLTQELSLAAEYALSPGVPIRFFALTRSTGMGVEIESADTLVDLEHNGILQEFAAHYDREQSLVTRRISKKAGRKYA